MAAVKVAGFASDGDGGLWENSRGVEQRAVMFTAIEAVAEANAGGRARGGYADRTAETATGDLRHLGLLLGEVVGSSHLTD